jgi:hypothetical protein
MMSYKRIFEPCERRVTTSAPVRGPTRIELPLVNSPGSPSKPHILGSFSVIAGVGRLAIAAAELSTRQTVQIGEARTT